MGASPPAEERRVSAPLVLTVASAMVCVGLVAAFGGRLFGTEAGEDDGTERPEVALDLDSEVGVAETFLDAYRKRDHETSVALSVQDARHQAEARAAEEERASPGELTVKAQVWDRMAAGRLRLEVRERERLDGSRAYLRTIATGRFLGKRYVREIGFEMVETEEGFRVARMHLGDILSGAPTLPAATDTPIDADERPSTASDAPAPPSKEGP